MIKMLQQNRLKWYRRHDMFQERMRMTGWKTCMDYKVESVRPRGRAQKTWTEVAEKTRSDNCTRRLLWTD